MNRWILTLLFLVVFFLYFPLNRRKPKYYWKTVLDDYIELTPIFIIPYGMYYFYVLFTYFYLWNTFRIDSYLTAMLIAQTIGVLIWYVFPTGVKRHKVKAVGLGRILDFVYRNDGDANALPSAHVYLTLISSFYLITYLPFAQALVAVVVSLLISISTIFTKQHYVLDVLGGALLAAISIFLCYNL